MTIESASLDLLKNRTYPQALQEATERLFLNHSKGQGHGPEFWHDVFNYLKANHAHFNGKK